MISDLLADLDILIKKYSNINKLEEENKALKTKLKWTKQCFKQALEILGHGDGDSRVEYLEHLFLNYFEE